MKKLKTFEKYGIPKIEFSHEWHKTGWEETFLHPNDFDSVHEVERCSDKTSYIFAAYKNKNMYILRGLYLKS